MTKEEYGLRKQQLIDELTGTSISSDNLSASRSRINSDGSIVLPIPTVMPHPPPNFDVINAERAIKYVFNWETKKWTESYCKVKMDDIPFAKGGLRLVYYLQVRKKKLIFFRMFSERSCC